MFNVLKICEKSILREKFLFPIKTHAMLSQVKSNSGIFKYSCCSIGTYWFFLLDWYVTLYPFFLIQALQMIVVVYVYGLRRFSIDIEV